jgi:cytochrome P450 family 4
MCDILHLRQTKIWLRPELIFQATNYGRAQKKLLGIIHGLTQKVLKIRKDQYEKNGKTLMPRIVKKEESEAKEKRAETSVKTDDKYSFGQSAGLKDDLDVDDNDVGEFCFINVIDVDDGVR